jgi:hypothetical protein
VERCIEEVARTVPREDASRAVRAVGSRGEADEEDARRGIPEAGDGSAPVLAPAEAGDLVAGHPLAPRHEARARAAVDEHAMKRAKRATAHASI